VDRDRVAGYMQAHGIGVGVHYRPVHLEPFYVERFGHEPEEFPIAEDAGNRLLSLPFWPELEPDLARKVAATLKDAIVESLG
jgi:perosamine synthetase